MIKWILISVLSMLFLQQPEEPMFQSDPQAKEILDRTSKTFKALDALKAELDIEITFPEQDSYEQTATVYLQGQKFRLEMVDEDMICDGKSMWRYLKEMNEVQISDYEPAEDEITPTNIFNIYENDFYFLYVDDDNELGKGYDVIDLTPMDKSKSYFKVRVWVNQSDSFINQMKVFDKNGSRYIYSIENIEQNPSLDDGLFQFNPDNYPADLHIEELRF